jgi:hypothetical protein
LNMDNSIGLNDLVNESSNFMLIHCPYFIKSIFITLFKSLELILKLFELFGELFIVIS